jgi:hypothetical protein
MAGPLARVVHHRMRAYFVPLAAGGVLVVSAFLPSVVHGGTRVGGLPSVSAFWILGLGVAAMLLASLSVVTRKNSRHPLLLVGLASLAIEFLGWQWLRRAVAEQAWASSQAAAIVAGGTAPAPGVTTAGSGVYAGVAASIVIVLFGLTIVIKKAGSAYAVPEDDV